MGKSLKERLRNTSLKAHRGMRLAIYLYIELEVCLEKLNTFCISACTVSAIAFMKYFKYDAKFFTGDIK